MSKHNTCLTDYTRLLKNTLSNCVFKMFHYRLLKRDIPKVESHRMAKDWKKINHAIIIRRKISIAIG